MMARHEEDREDLLAEARALFPRVEIEAECHETPIVLGHRRQGFLSVYFDQDPVYHFDDQGGLRRSYRQKFLYRSAGVRLTRIHRARSDAETTLLTSDLTDEECQQFLKEMRQQLSGVEQCLVEGRFTILRSVPEEVDLKLVFLPLLQQVLATQSPLSPSLRKTPSHG